MRDVSAGLQREVCNKTRIPKKLRVIVLDDIFRCILAFRLTCGCTRKYEESSVSGLGRTGM